MRRAPRAKLLLLLLVALRSVTTTAAAAVSCQSLSALGLGLRGDHWPQYLDPGRAHPTTVVNWTHAKCFALVLPYFPSQTERLSAALSKWRDLQPCMTPPSEASCVDLVFVQTRADYTLSAASAPELQPQRDASLLALVAPVAHCFRRVDSFSLGIPERWDTRTDGSSFVFYTILNSVLLRESYGHLLLFEPDMSPLQPNWLSAARQQADSNKCCERFWHAGSPPRCSYEFYGRDHERRDFHQNGNALYCLGDPAFDQYRQRVQAYYNVSFPGSRTAAQPEEDGFDHALFQFRLQPENYAYSLTVVHKFIYVEWIANYCEGRIPTDPGPGTLLGHTKYEFFDAPTRYILHAFPGAFGRFPSETELALLKPVVKKAQQSAAVLWPDKMSDLVCQSELRHRFNKECRWEARFPGRLYAWSTDLHGAPIACNMGLFFDIGVVTHAEIDGPHCEHFGICRDRLQVFGMDDWRGFSLDPNPALLTSRFVQTYKHDPEFQRVDVVLCSHPVANCELYLDLGKPLIIYATTRMEFGRLDRFVDWRTRFLTNLTDAEARWASWVATLQRLAAQPWNAILANNVYDANYIKYFTGLSPQVLPSWCGDHVSASYQPRGKEVLIVPYRENLDYPKFRSAETWAHPVLAGLLQQLAATFGSVAKAPYSFVRLRDRYPAHYSFEDLASHPAVLYVPYQSSVMSFFELYRANIPIFAPSHKLLCQWQRQHGLTWERVYGDPPRLSKSWEWPYDPNSNASEDACAWLAFSDQYQMPHIILFDSWIGFIAQLLTVDFADVSNRMKAHNKKLYANLTFEWNHVLRKVVSEAKRRDTLTAREASRMWYTKARRGASPPRPAVSVFLVLAAGFGLLCLRSARRGARGGPRARYTWRQKAVTA